MRLDKFTIKAQEALQAARTIAEEHSHQQLEPEHLLLALLGQPEGVVGPILQRLGVELSLVEDRMRQELKNLPKIIGAGLDQVYLSPRLNRVLDLAWREAGQIKDEYVSGEHLLIALAQGEGPSGELLQGFGINKDTILKVLVDIRGTQRVTDQNPETSPTWPVAENWILSSVETTRSVGSCRFSPEEQRTIQCSSAMPEWGRRP
jgi:ATP-dependent Clp protease ATP-binding subunit ClpB